MKKYKTGYLILHGFAGSRHEIRSLIGKLEEIGCYIAAPLLAGHEASRKELARTKYSDWLNSGEDAILALEKQCEDVVVIGFSMGGLIGVNLCQTHPVAALVLVNTPVYYWNIHRIVENLVHDFQTYSTKYFKASADKPLFSLLEFVALLNKTKPLFSNIHCSSMIIQTLDDDTVNPKSAEYIYSRIQGHKIISTYQTGGHMVFQNDSGESIGEDILNFLREYSLVQ